MKATVLFILSLSLAGLPALAATISGNGALSLAALVGQQSPHLTTAQKALLLKYLNGKARAPYPKGKEVVVKADSARCRISNVDIAAHSCDLQFGAKTVSLSGRKAHELYATLIENGVPSDGAAGSIYEATGALTCKIVPAEVAQEAGAGAKCDYAPAN
ncbi:hypothetical protein [uncultured Rhodoblastus sp.]|uniref:hypothetical protein n=1 Tax=uncultured Rhodoblastus sp. TaxID=543037 RepID=UPI0025EB355A|nr:hypothetical protein [uncultured Rhodoblastus sp.]